MRHRIYTLQRNGDELFFNIGIVTYNTYSFRQFISCFKVMTEICCDLGHIIRSISRPLYTHPDKLWVINTYGLEVKIEFILPITFKVLFSTSFTLHSAIEGLVIQSSIPPMQPATQTNRSPVIDLNPFEIDLFSSWFGKWKEIVSHLLIQSTTPQNTCINWRMANHDIIRITSCKNSESRSESYL